MSSLAAADYQQRSTLASGVMPVWMWKERRREKERRRDGTWFEHIPSTPRRSSVDAAAMQREMTSVLESEEFEWEEGEGLAESSLCVGAACRS